VTKLYLTVVISILAGPVLAADPGPVKATGPDYEAIFAKSFPASAGEHQILDWKLYAALASTELIAYAAAVDPTVARQLEQSKGKGYQTQQVEEALKRDPRVRAAFDDQRRRIKAMALYVEGDGTEACKRSLVYVGQEFRLVLGEDSQRGDPLALATVAPSCPQLLREGFQITAGRSPRFKCWPNGYGRACGLRLPDMPAELKKVIEDQYPKSIKLRWRWRGLSGTAHVQDQEGRWAKKKGVAVAVPTELGLAFVDGSGHVLWTATATDLAKRGR
jgi:hypothetical protein